MAIPRLVPASPNISDPNSNAPTSSFVPANPAAIQWGMPTRWGIGQIMATRGETVPPPDTTEGIDNTKEFGGLYVGGRSFSKKFSVAGELMELSDDPKEFPLEADWDVLRAGVAFLSGDSVTFGAGMDRVSNIQGYNPVDYDTTILGITFQLSQTYYLGLAMGTEKISHASIGESDRAVRKYGIAYSKGQGKSHIEYYIIEKTAPEEFSDQADSFSDVKTNGVVAETILGKFYIGAGASLTNKDLAGVTLTQLSFDVGWAAKRGLSLLYHRESTATHIEYDEWNFNINDVVTQTTEYNTVAQAVTLVYSF